MLRKYWKKCVNYETISYLICGVLTTAVDFGVFSVARKMGVNVGLSQAMSWLAAVLFAYVVNKLIVFRNYNASPAYIVREAAAFVAARAFSGVVVWILMMVMVEVGGDRSFAYELFCKLTSSIVNMGLNYVFSKVWIFKSKPE